MKQDIAQGHAWRKGQKQSVALSYQNLWDVMSGNHLTILLNFSSPNGGLSIYCILFLSR